MSKYIAEYAKSSRSKCQVCHEKIDKLILRIGKKVTMTFGELGYPRQLPVWFHLDCFFSPSNAFDKKDLKTNNFSNYDATTLSAADQAILYERATGQVMSVDTVSQLEEEEEERKEEAVYTDSPADIIVPTMLQKYLSKALVVDLQQMISTYKIKVDVKRPKKADLLRCVSGAPLTQIPGIVYAAIDKTMTASDIKTNLTTANLKTTGSKKDLIWRFLGSIGISESNEVWEMGSEVAKKEKKKLEKMYKRGDSLDDISFDSFSINSDPKRGGLKVDKTVQDAAFKMLTICRHGNLEEVRKLIAKHPKNPWIVNYANVRHEVDEKWGYSKEWYWYSDTPIITAVRNQNLDLVLLLLKSFANPLLSSSPSDDVHEDAMTVSEKQWGVNLQLVNSLLSTVNRESSWNFQVARQKLIKSSTEEQLKRSLESYFQQLKTSVIIYKIISAIARFWAGSSSHYNNECKLKRPQHNSTPTDATALIQTIDDTFTETSRKSFDELSDAQFEVIFETLRDQWKGQLQKREAERKHVEERRRAEEKKRLEEEGERERIRKIIEEQRQTSGNLYCQCGQLGSTSCVQHSCVNCCTSAHCPRHGGTIRSNPASAICSKPGPFSNHPTMETPCFQPPQPSRYTAIYQHPPVCSCGKPGAFKCTLRRCVRCCTDLDCTRHNRLY